jgi:ATP-dependent Clp protease ATP-binding subunit ClpA
MIGVSSPTRPIEHRAGQEATAVGHHWFGEEHLVLALLAADPEGAQARALSELGVSHDTVKGALVAHIAEQGPPTPKQYDGALSVGSYHDALGRAEGLALGTGATTPEPNHWWPAVLWDDQGTVATLLSRLGPSRSQVLAVVDTASAVPPSVSPNPLLPAAERQALAREHNYIAADDVLLALLVDEPDDQIRRILETHGLSHERVADAVRQAGERATPPSPRSPGATSATPNPACRQLLARSEGLAVTIGQGTPRSAEAFIAYLWDRHAAAVLTLERLGVSAADVVADLAAAGVRLPAAPLPEPDRRPWGERIFIPEERIRDVLEVLIERLGPGRFGFNTHEGRAWVMAHADIDLQALVDEALSGPSEGA